MMRPAATLLFSYSTNTSWSSVCLFHKDLFCAEEYTSREPRPCSRDAGRRAKSAANLNTEQQKGSEMRAGRSLSSGVLPFKTALAGLGRRKVLLCCSWNIPSCHLVHIRHIAASLAAGNSPWHCARCSFSWLCCALTWSCYFHRIIES